MQNKKVYERVIASAGDLWVSGDATDNPEYLRGQVETISGAFDVEEDRVREDILDAAGIYRDIRWDGVRVPLVESGTSPWVQGTLSCKPFDFGGDGFRELTDVVLVSGTEIQSNDSTDFVMGEGFTDLHAASIAASEVTRITGEIHEVWFHGTY